MRLTYYNLARSAIVFVSISCALASPAGHQLIGRDGLQVSPRDEAVADGGSSHSRCLLKREESDVDSAVSTPGVFI
jgi:hypothetical protein